MTDLELNELATKFYEQAYERACELVGPNAYNYDPTAERIEEELWDEYNALWDEYNAKDRPA